jgi:hypothetical protein
MSYLRLSLLGQLSDFCEGAGSQKTSNTVAYFIYNRSNFLLNIFFMFFFIFSNILFANNKYIGKIEGKKERKEVSI